MTSGLQKEAFFLAMIRSFSLNPMAGFEHFFAATYSKFSAN